MVVGSPQARRAPAGWVDPGTGPAERVFWPLQGPLFFVRCASDLDGSGFARPGRMLLGSTRRAGRPHPDGSATDRSVTARVNAFDVRR